MNAQLTNVADVRAFALAGNATLTLRSKVSGNRFTYRIRRPGDDRPHFVSLLNGSDNEGSYEYLGTIINDSYGHGRKSKITADAMSAKAFDWFWLAMRKNIMPIALEIWHEGRCGRCGRKLTVPESIASGIGPECAKRGGLKSPAEAMSNY